MDEGIISMSEAFYKCDTSNPLVVFMCATKPKHIHNFQVWEDIVSQYSNTCNKSYKQMRWFPCGGSHCHSLSKIRSDPQHCLQEGHCIPCHNWQYPILHLPWCHKNVISVFGEQKRKWVYYKHLHYMFRFLFKLHYDNDKFIHSPTYTTWLLLNY